LFEYVVSDGNLLVAQRLYRDADNPDELLKHRDASGNTPLMNATGSSRAQLRMFKWLIKKGADVNAVNNAGETIAHKLAYSGALSKLKILLKTNFNKLLWTHTSEKWQTVIHRAAMRSKAGAECIDWLRINMPNGSFSKLIDHCDKDNLRALDYALNKRVNKGIKFRRFCPKLVRALLKKTRNCNGALVDENSIHMVETGYFMEEYVDNRKVKQGLHKGLKDIKSDRDLVKDLLKHKQAKQRRRLNVSNNTSSTTCVVSQEQLHGICKKAPAPAETSLDVISCTLFLCIALLATYLFARVFYRAYKAKLAPVHVRDSFAAGRHDHQALEIIVRAC